MIYNYVKSRFGSVRAVKRAKYEGTGVAKTKMADGDGSRRARGETLHERLVAVRRHTRSCTSRNASKPDVPL